jgi:hypothetical protein
MLKGPLKTIICKNVSINVVQIFLKEPLVLVLILKKIRVSLHSVLNLVIPIEKLYSSSFDANFQIQESF